MDYQDEMLQRAGALEQTVKTKGWEYVKAYVEDRIKTFTNEAVMSGFKGIEEYQFKRGMVAGLLDLINTIQSDLDGLNQYREQERSKPTRQS